MKKVRFEVRTGEQYFCYVLHTSMSVGTDQKCPTAGREAVTDIILRISAPGQSIAWLCPRCCGNPRVQRMVGEWVKEFDDVEVGRYDYRR